MVVSSSLFKSKVFTNNTAAFLLTSSIVFMLDTVHELNNREFTNPVSIM